MKDLLLRGRFAFRGAACRPFRRNLTALVVSGALAALIGIEENQRRRNGDE